MELKILRHFVVIAHERNFSNAAVVLRVSQPALSRQIGALEEELGTKLFERHHTHLVLTPAGSFLYDQAQSLLKEAGRIKANIPHTQFKAGSLRIQCAESVAIAEISEALVQVIEAFPKTAITLTSTSNGLNPLPIGLQEDNYDFFVSSSQPANHQYECTALQSVEEWFLLVRKDDALAQKPSVTLDDLRDQALLLPENVEATPLNSWLALESDTLNIRGVFNIESTAASMVKAKLGVALYAGTQFEDAELTRIKLDPEVIGHPSLIWLSDRKLSDQAQYFLDYLEQKQSAVQ